MTADELDALPEGSVIVAERTRPVQAQRPAAGSDEYRVRPLVAYRRGGNSPARRAEPWELTGTGALYSTADVAWMSRSWTVLRRGRP